MSAPRRRDDWDADAWGFLLTHAHRLATHFVCAGQRVDAAQIAHRVLHTHQDHIANIVLYREELERDIDRFIQAMKAR